MIRTAKTSPAWSLIFLGILSLCWGLLGCEGQQNINKAAFDAAEAAVKADPKYSEIFDKMEYHREEVHVWVKPGNSLPEDKGATIMFIAQTMGDAIKADPTNKLKEFTIKGFIEEEELWVFRYDMKEGKTYLEKSRLVTTI